MVDQIHDHRHAERVGEQDVFLPSVAAHLSGLGEELDRRHPFGLGQLHVLDEGMQVTDETLHDVPQARVGRGVEAPQHFGGDVVFGRPARHDRRHGIGLHVDARPF